MKAASMVLCCIIAYLDASSAEDKDEHWRIPDSAYATVLRELGGGNGPSLADPVASRLQPELEIWQGSTFGELSLRETGCGLPACRFHARGKSVLQQLCSLDSSEVYSAISRHVTDDTAAQGGSAMLSDHNVLANYLVHHLIALHYGKRAGQNAGESMHLLQLALLYEAKAQSYLIDAFSAGHLLVPLSDPWSFLHPMNNAEAHDFYSSQGVYVLNSKGEQWQAFGDKLLQWYAPTFEHLFGGCCSSLRELFLVYYVFATPSRLPVSLKGWLDSIGNVNAADSLVNKWLVITSGNVYLTDSEMPTLRLLPMPISMTWSKRTDIIDTHGIAHRIQYPQLKASRDDPAFCDPHIQDMDEEFLYHWGDLPGWMLPDAWVPPDSLGGRSVKDLSRGRRDSLAANLIKHDPSIASVRFIQERYYPPSYYGLLTSIGVTSIIQSDSHYSGIIVGLGCAPPWTLLSEPAFVSRISANASWSHFFGDEERSLVSINVGLGVSLFKNPAGTHKTFRYTEYVRLDGGYAWGIGPQFKGHGWLASLAIETGAVPLWFTYGGLIARPRIACLFFDKTYFQPSLEIVIE